MVSGNGHWICTSYSKVDGVNVYEREMSMRGRLNYSKVFMEKLQILLKVYWLVP